MHGTESISVVDETRRATTADGSAEFAAERAIRARIALGDTQAATAMCRQLYAEAVGRYCKAALGDSELVKQAVMDTWSRSVQELEKADAARTIRSLLLGLARRRCAYLLETNQLQPDATARSHDFAVATQPTAQKLPRPEMARRLLSRLRPSEREVLILRYVSKLTYSEIACLWGIGESDARTRVSQALAHVTALSKGEDPRHG